MRAPRFSQGKNPVPPNHTAFCHALEHSKMRAPRFSQGKNPVRVRLRGSVRSPSPLARRRCVRPCKTRAGGAIQPRRAAPRPGGRHFPGRVKPAPPPGAWRDPLSCASLEHSILHPPRRPRSQVLLHRGRGDYSYLYRGRNARFQVILACFPGIRRRKDGMGDWCAVVVDRNLQSGSAGEDSKRNRQV